MLHEITDRIRNLLCSGQAPEPDVFGQLGSELAAVVKGINLRLQACASLLAQRRRSEAVALATSRPNLFDVVAQLDTQSIDECNRLLHQFGISAVETVDTRIVHELYSASLDEKVGYPRRYQIPSITLIGLPEQLAKYTTDIVHHLKRVLPKHFDLAVSRGVLSEADDVDLLSLDDLRWPTDEKFTQKLSEGIKLKCDLETISKRRRDTFEMTFSPLSIDSILGDAVNWEELVDGPCVLLLDEFSQRRGRFRVDAVIRALAARFRTSRRLREHQLINSTLVLCCHDALLSRRLEAELGEEISNVREAVYGSLNVPIIQKVSDSLRDLILAHEPELIEAAESAFSNVMYIPIDYEVVGAGRTTFTPDIPILYSTHTVAPNLIVEPVRQVRRSDEQLESDVSERPSVKSDHCKRLDMPIHRGNHGGLDVSKHDPVDCAVFAPAQAAAGEDVLIQVFVYPPNEALLATKAAAEFDDESCKRGTRMLGALVPHGASLRFDLSFASLNKVLDSESIIWRGQVESVQFSLSLPAETRLGNLVGSLTATIDSVPFGEIKFKLKIVGGNTDRRLTSVGKASRYTQAFISYASNDRVCVMSQLGVLSAAGIAYFQDIVDLEPGERWERKLYEKIHETDVMFLFWSTAAKNSEWVEKEWRYGLEHKGSAYIRPVFIEGPPIPTPPSELKFMQFNDKRLYFLKALERISLES